MLDSIPQLIQPMSWSEVIVVKEGGSEHTFKIVEAIIEMVGQWPHGVNRGVIPAELIVF
jgi:hypothetical protein